MNKIQNIALVVNQQQLYHKYIVIQLQITTMKSLHLAWDRKTDIKIQVTKGHNMFSAKEIYRKLLRILSNL